MVTEVVAGKRDVVGPVKLMGRPYHAVGDVGVVVVVLWEMEEEEDTDNIIFLTFISINKYYNMLSSHLFLLVFFLHAKQLKGKLK